MRLRDRLLWFVGLKFRMPDSIYNEAKERGGAAGVIDAIEAYYTGLSCRFTWTQTILQVFVQGSLALAFPKIAVFSLIVGAGVIVYLWWMHYARKRDRERERQQRRREWEYGGY